jgi:hypothetical protein
LDDEPTDDDVMLFFFIAGSGNGKALICPAMLYGQETTTPTLI